MKAATIALERSIEYGEEGEVCLRLSEIGASRPVSPTFPATVMKHSTSPVSEIFYKPHQPTPISTVKIIVKSYSFSFIFPKMFVAEMTMGCRLVGHVVFFFA